MNEEQVLQFLRETAKTVNPTGSYIPGRFSDGSLLFDAPGDQIHLDYMDEESDDLTTVYKVKMFFATQDSAERIPVAEFDGGPTQQPDDNRQALLSAVKAKGKRFMRILRQTDGPFSIIGREQFNVAIMATSGGHSGFILSFLFSTSVGYCIP